MNSDPFDSAAWRSFGMLDADETAIFDGAVRHDPSMWNAHIEMDRLAAAVAVTTIPPVVPHVRHLEHLQTRLGLQPSRKKYVWLATAGWTAAALLALAMFVEKAYRSSNSAALSIPASVINSARNATEARAATKVETKRLIQEIVVLRDNLEKFQVRDRALFQPAPGVAFPIVMTMSPPGVTFEDSANLPKDEAPSPITALLGDALTSMTAFPTDLEKTEADPAAQDFTHLPDHPTAIPIYDAARDSGTLVVSNLPPTEQGEVYNLWVTTRDAEQPIYVGSLPEVAALGADSFDFSLGSTMVLPTGFLLTRDTIDSPAQPNDGNTILLGPPAP